MVPLVVLVAITLTPLALGAAGLHRLRSWPVALRGGLAAMFTLTGVTHFVGMREDFISMVPPALPDPGLLVTVTGVLELAGAAGLLVGWTVPWASAGLAALLIAMFPANVYASVAGTELGDAPAMALLPRTMLQLVFLAATLAVLAHHVRNSRVTGNGPSQRHSQSGAPPAPPRDEDAHAAPGTDSARSSAATN